MAKFVLAIDQGTTSTRAVAFDQGLVPRAVAQIELPQHFPQPGWVEHDPEDIWSAAEGTCKRVIAEIGGVGNVAAIGVTNQRETTLVWDRATGECVHRAIVWQDRRTADVTARLRAEGAEAKVIETTGLLLDPYFSATKIAWILDKSPDLRARAEKGELAFGTIDSFLIWRLTGGGVHAIDATNASRTLLYDLRRGAWSEDMAALFRVPLALLPTVTPCDGPFGETTRALFGASVPIAGVAGDQQAALIGHGCTKPGMLKATYGTGCFLVLNAGREPRFSNNRLLATIGYDVAGERAFALEGAIFSAGATMQWLRDGLRLIKTAAESEAIAAGLKDNAGVYLVPAFAGLGAPQWVAEARGAVFGLTRDATANHLVRAGLEAVAYQTRDLLDALRADGTTPSRLLVDGGLTSNTWAMQFLADMCDLEVARPAFAETTALGAAKLAALHAGFINDINATGGAYETFSPRMCAADRDRFLGGWRAAVAGVIAQVRFAE